MQIAIATSWFESKTLLSSGDAQRVDDFITKLHKNPANPGLGLERVQGADDGMWSARVTLKIRAIMHKDGGRYILLHVGPHDKAYKWAEKHCLRTHPVTGEIQLLAIKEGPAIEEPAQRSKPSEPTQAASTTNETAVQASNLIDFSIHSVEFLLSLGVPPDWVDRLRAVHSNDQFLALLEQLPPEVGERVYSLALNEEVKPPKPLPPDIPLDEAPQHRAKFHVVEDSDELIRILSEPFEKWMLFLHPSQQQLVDGEFKGPVKITGSAGTGKTVVAIHRARALAQKGKRVLLTTYTRKLCQSIRRKIDFLCTPEERERIVVDTVSVCAINVLRAIKRTPKALAQADAERFIKQSYRKENASGLSVDYVTDEWRNVIEPNGIATAQEYVDANRAGRGIALTKEQRVGLWTLFQQVLDRGAESDRLPWGLICREAEQAVRDGKAKPGYDAVIVDEVQDLNPPHLRLLAAIAGTGPDRLMLIGDAGQRIYIGGFSLASLGIECRGRSHLLKLNYRTTQQIEAAAERLRGQAVDDLEGGTHISRTNRCLLNGTPPVVKQFKSFEQEDEYVAGEIQRLLGEGVSPPEIAVFARTKKSLFFLHQRLKKAGIPINELDDSGESEGKEGVVCGTMHGAKGLEFRHVFIVACRKNQLPASFELDKAKTAKDREAVIERERNLLYVAMTRAREQVYITTSMSRSKFLDDLET